MKVKDILKACEPVWNNNDSSDKAPFYSVLLPIDRRVDKGLLKKCIESVVNQEFRDLELIVIDDASTDDVYDVIKDFMAKDSRVKSIRHTYEIGISAISEYEGFMKARGKYIAFIFDGCIWKRDYLLNVSEYIKNTGAKIVVSSVKLLDNSQLQKEMGTPVQFSLLSLTQVNYIPNSGVIVDRCVLEDKRVGLYDPHIVQTRACNWMLWRRAEKYYLIHSTDISGGIEAEVSNSLQNIYDFDECISLEREVEARTIDFSPSSFEDIDVVQYSAKASKLYEEAILDLTKRFRDKRWYQAEEGELCVKSTSSYPSRRKRIGIIGQMGATIGLCIERFTDRNDDFVFQYLGLIYDEKKLLNLDAAIIVRVEEYKQNNIELCKKYSIPFFYFTDDNFVVLSDENIYEGSVVEESNNWKNGHLNEYDGVLVSTDPLREYIVEHKYAPKDKTVTFPCVVDTEGFSLNSMEEHGITLAFLGGIGRVHFFKTEILPQLKKIAENNKVSLVCAFKEEYENIDFGNIEMFFLEPSNSVQRILEETKQYNISVLLHFGQEQGNNEFKTVNALWNALYLGATLVTNNTRPFNRPELKECLTIVDNFASISDRLIELINDREKQNKIYNNALNYTNEYNNYNNIEKIFSHVMSDVSSTSSYMLMKRNMIYTLPLEEKVESFSRSISGELLNFAGMIKKKRSYYITCRYQRPTKIGLCFAKCLEEKAEGYVTVAVSDENGRQLCNETKAFSELNWNDWTYFQMQGADNMINRILNVEISCSYAKESVGVGVFECALSQKGNSKKFKTRFIHGCYDDLNVLFADC